MVPRQDQPHELTELSFHCVLGLDDARFRGLLLLLVEVVLADEGGEARDVRVVPGGFSGEEVVDFALGGGALEDGFFVEDFGLSSGDAGVVDSLLYNSRQIVIGLEDAGMM